MKSMVTDIEYLSKTRQTYSNELSFAGRGLKLNTREDAQEIVKSILECKTLQVIRLEGNTISPEAAEELGKALEKHPELERFIVNDIFTGRLKDEIPLALKSICGALNTAGCHLVEVNMSDNAYGPIGLNALIDFFQSPCCYTIKEIRMHNNGLGPDGAKKFADALQKGYDKSGGRFQLRVFICGRNRLEYEGARTISVVLKTMGTLEEIQMPQNGIRPNAIEFLADACANNPNLRVVNFNDNTFRKIGGDLVAKALTNLKKLEYVNFGDCLIRSKGAVQIARSLANLENIKECILSFNEISLQAGLEIAKLMLKCKNTLQLLDLNGNKFGEEGKLEMKSILEPVANTLGSFR
jgi:Ran GTPase-activating protein 1